MNEARFDVRDHNAALLKHVYEVLGQVERVECRATVSFTEVKDRLEVVQGYAVNLVLHRLGACLFLDLFLRDFVSDEEVLETVMLCERLLLDYSILLSVPLINDIYRLLRFGKDDIVELHRLVLRALNDYRQLPQQRFFEVDCAEFSTAFLIFAVVPFPLAFRVEGQNVEEISVDHVDIANERLPLEPEGKPLLHRFLRPETKSTLVHPQVEHPV